MTTPDILIQWANCMKEVEALRLENSELRAELEATKKQVPAEAKVWFTPPEAAKFIGKPLSFFRNHRDRIPHRRDSYKVIFYHLNDLQAFIDANRRTAKKESKREQ